MEHQAENRFKRPNTRISAACSPCRAKKQKCSGEKPQCEQCRAAGRECIWPKQIKRGPSKDYIRTLESRLRHTEGLLLQVLPHVSDEQLAAALSEMDSLSAVAVAVSLSDAHDSAAGAGDGEHSLTHHLRSLEDIRMWYQERMRDDSSTRERRNSPRPGSRHPAPGELLSAHGSPSDDITENAATRDITSQLQYPPATSRDYLPLATSMATASITPLQPNDFSGPPFGNNISIPPPNLTQSSVSQSLLLSPSFQEAFIW